MGWRSAGFSEYLDAGLDGVGAGCEQGKGGYTVLEAARRVIGIVGICPYDTMFVRWNANLLVAKT